MTHSTARGRVLWPTVLPRDNKPSSQFLQSLAEGKEGLFRKTVGKTLKIKDTLRKCKITDSVIVSTTSPGYILCVTGGGGGGASLDPRLCTGHPVTKWPSRLPPSFITRNGGVTDGKVNLHNADRMSPLLHKVYDLGSELKLMLYYSLSCVI